FIPKLKQHILFCLTHPDEYIEDKEFEQEQWNKVKIASDHVYVHKSPHVSYTTYDLRHGEDTMNPHTHSDVMVLKCNEADAHPFSYARILGVFHVKVEHEDLLSMPQDIDVLWVCWFQVSTKYRSGMKCKWLTRLSFVKGTDAFDFVSPDIVIHGSQIIPAFVWGPTDTLLGCSVAQQTFHMDILDKNFSWLKEPEMNDYLYHYVNL
ncbi:hypothetical protein BDN71DRAFT_1392748, partial [Pleurotus eryngii]